MQYSTEMRGIAQKGEACVVQYSTEMRGICAVQTQRGEMVVPDRE